MLFGQACERHRNELLGVVSIVLEEEHEWTDTTHTDNLVAGRGVDCQIGEGRGSVLSHKLGGRWARNELPNKRLDAAFLSDLRPRVIVVVRKLGQSSCRLLSVSHAIIVELFDERRHPAGTGDDALNGTAD